MFENHRFKRANQLLFVMHPSKNKVLRFDPIAYIQLKKVKFILDTEIKLLSKGKNRLYEILSDF